MRTLVLLTIALAAPAFAEDRPEVVVADFESETYGAWTTTGDAFGPGPAKGALPGQMVVGDFQGERLVNSFFGGDGSVGTLTSPEFTVERTHLRFLIGGGRHPDELSMRLVIDGKPVRTATGHDSEFLRAASWDLGEFAGKTARIEVVDRRKGGWGHINVDQIVQADSVPTPPDERAALLAKAEAADRAAADRAERDPLRPTFHVLPPANWINDPNGPIYYKGYYHLFYQHNPYGDGWGNMHWGHVRSKDLARWERMPLALWPSKALGEDHVFSGSATVSPKGDLMLFYTSIGGRKPEQWVALPDSDDLTLWKKHPANPILTEDLHGDVKVHEWRDPYVFRSEGKTYMVLGGNLNASKGGQGVVNVYRAEDDALTRWTYLGVLFTHPDREVKNVECPLFFPLGGKWVLIVSQGRPVQWFVGDLDAATMTFRPERRGVVDGGNFYAPNVMLDPKGRALLWGWVPDFPKGRGWNGCLTLPRVLSLTKDGDLASEPAPELSALRTGERARIDELAVADGTKPLGDLKGDSLELRLRLEPGDAKTCGVRLRRSAEGTRSTTVSFDGTTLDVAGARVPASLPRGEKSLGLHVFLDRSVLEVTTSTGAAVTRVIAPDPDDLGVEVFATGGAATFRDVDAWTVGTIWKTE